MFWQILPSTSLFVWLLEGFDLYIYIYIIYYIYTYIYIYIYIQQIYYIMNKYVWCMFNEKNSFERYFFHHWAWLNMFMMWYIYCITNTEETSENIYHIYLWHTKCLNLAEVRWPLWNMMYVMCTELLHCI